MEKLEQHIEAIIFASEKPIKIQEINSCLEKINGEALPEEAIEVAIAAIDERFKGDQFAFSLVKSGGGYQFLTKADYHESVAVLLHQNSRRKLTTAALETLAIIAYKQPVTKVEIEQIRGVNSDYTVNKLMEKELVEIVGRSEEVGKPLLYGTSAFFMDYFGINSIDELPKIKEFTDTENQIGVLPDVDLPSEN
jgi:segregation and condensation protein B